MPDSSELPLIPRSDPRIDPRVRRTLDMVADRLNGLARSGQLQYGAGAGTATISISLAASSGLEYSGGALRIDLREATTLNLTSTGLGFADQTGSTVFASPANGGSGLPGFRSLANGDLPAGVPRSIGNASVRVAGNVTLAAGANVTIVASGSTLTIDSTGGGGGGGGSGNDARSAWYPIFTPGADDDEFDDASFTGWTAVGNVTLAPVVTELNDVASMVLPGGDPVAGLHAYLKPRTITAGSYVESAFSGMGVNQNFNICGVIMADGTTLGSGSQVVWYYSPDEQKWGLLKTTGFNTQVDFNGYTVQYQAPFGTMFVRLVYAAANTFQGWVSPDGVSWVNVTGNITEAVTPTKAGFFATTWGGVNPFCWSVKYVKFN